MTVVVKVNNTNNISLSSSTSASSSSSLTPEFLSSETRCKEIIK